MSFNFEDAFVPPPRSRPQFPMSDSSPPTYDSSAPFSSLASMPGRSEQLSLRETSSNEGAPLSHRETNSSMYQETLHEYWPGSEGNTLDYGTRGRIIRGAEMRSTGSDNGDIAYFGALALKEAKEKAEKKRLKALGTPKSEIDSLGSLNIPFTLDRILIRSTCIVRGPAINSSKYLLPGFGLTEERFRRIIEDANSVLSSIRPQDRANGKNGVSIMVDAFARELVARGKGDLTLVSFFLVLLPRSL